MTRHDSHAFHLSDTYLQLLDGGAAKPIPVDAEFWAKIGEREELHAGRMVGLFHMDKSPDHREVHPRGDEVLILLSGAVDVVLEDELGERVIELRDQGACIVPRGVWHGQIVRAPSVMIFITPGEGTQHRAS
ncbi:hypothetical protein WME98_44230 [Sorangium sp. So ce296]|uniref:cupin domain-containing protein n=1 Tax=unclassified Sorangium TaxID=2621164 RepID=UPI003F5E5825